MKYKNFLFIYFVFLIYINISFAKKNKNSEDIKPPQIYELELNDHYPNYIEFTLIGQFSKEKTGFSLYFGNDKVTLYNFEKGDVKILNVTSTPDQTISPTPDNTTQTPNPTPSPSPTETNKPDNETQAPKETEKPEKESKNKSKEESEEETSKPKKHSNKKLKTSHLLQKKNDKKPKKNNSSQESTKEHETDKPSPTLSPSTSPSSSPSVSPSSSPSVSPSSSPSSSPTTTPTPTVLVQENDRVSFNITSFVSFKSINITIRYKNGMEARVPFTLESIISSITRVNNTGGIVDIKGRFILNIIDQDSSPPEVKIGSKTCELVSFSTSVIRCYLPNGSACQNSISIKNIQSFNSTKYEYCYSNPIIDRVIGIPNQPQTPHTKVITILGHNFNQSPQVYLEKSSKLFVERKKCENRINSDTIIVCELNTTYTVVERKNSKLLQTEPGNDQIHYSLFVLNVPGNISIDQAKVIPFYSNIVGEYDFNKQQSQNSGSSSSSPSLDFDFKEEKVDKNNKNNSGGSNYEDAKFYLLIIIPSVLFIVIVVLIAVFIKTRAKGKDKIPFLVLNDIGTGNEIHYNEKIQIINCTYDSNNYINNNKIIEKFK
ncbi:hypothetical protein DICPUDRAFT_79792 [Dictyostelium purpureum]|uniref:IPT/TIG domain-containing protein n=1 Tax=Dictyostelium purpureum TaxID=5786 RepID=F0ZNM7_DICPU|nr:uncharacterized protein DICPUDRAFT_79792 [Dictyostelium purpureum]EGC34436.1 hypothetical protein DICPUDRAFT_79792 [Dictyostelium purpureum]|eukprot:XP_003289021.1 hypothetical protein DICPUDRAFT_79792 [Dictyostelium purpureum]